MYIIIIFSALPYYILVKKVEGFNKESWELRITAQGYGIWGKKGPLLVSADFSIFCTACKFTGKRSHMADLYLIFLGVTFLSSISYCYFQAECTPNRIIYMICRKYSVFLGHNFSIFYIALLFSGKIHISGWWFLWFVEKHSRYRR